ncbi:MAG: hypothetical protein ABEJ85_05615 [Haloarculaceae archaeon]
MSDLVCARCGDAFRLDEDHTEVVRRDFVDIPRPSRVEHLCRSCWQAYVENFLGEEFDRTDDVERRASR